MTKRQYSRCRHRRALRRGVAAIAALGTIAAVGGWMALQPASSEAADSTSAINRRLPVEVVRIERKDGYTVDRTFSGLVQARRSSDLSFQRSGPLVEITVDEGAWVQAGQTLARLDTRRLDARHRQLVAERNAAAARLDEMVAGPRAEVIAAARAALDARTAVHERLARRWQRMIDAHERGAANDDELDRARFEAETADADRRATDERLGELLAGTRAEQITAQRARVDALSAELDHIDIELADSALTAPYDGRIDRRLTDEGTVVDTGQPVLQLVESGELEAWIGVPAGALAAVPANAVLSIEVGGARVAARARATMPAVDEPTRTVNLVLTLAPEADTLVLPGQVARLPIEERIVSPGFWVPVAALAKGQRGLWSVYALDADDRVERAAVEVMHATDEQAFVRGALADGRLVVAGGVHRLAPGQHVETLER